jgi:hypothetical protein
MRAYDKLNAALVKMTKERFPRRVSDVLGMGMKYRARYRGPYDREPVTFLTLDLYGNDYPDATVDGIHTFTVRSARGFAKVLDRAEAVLDRLKEINRKHAEFKAWLANC